MNIRLLGTTLCIAALCFFITNASTPQTRRSAARLPRPSATSVIPGLSPETRTSIAGIQAVTVPWFDSLETGAPGWTKTGFWHISFKPQHIEVLNPAINPTLVQLPDSGFLPSAYSGNNVFWYGEDSTGTYIGSDYTQVMQSPLGGGTSVQSNSGSVITPPMNLVGQKNALLSFWTWWEIEAVNTNSFDLMHVEASTDSGITWNPIGRGVINPVNNPNGDDWKAYSSGGLGKRGKWIQAFFDLTPYAGKVVMVRFRFDTGDELYNGFRGWLIDNISVTATVAGVPTITSVSPQIVNPDPPPPSLPQVVEIFGTNFVSGATLQVDSTFVFGASVVSTTLMQFKAPAISNGPHSILITNPDGKFVVKTNAFSITTDSPPVITSVQPDSARAGASALTTITGSNFAPGATVDIGGSLCTGVQLLGATQISAFSPNNLAPGAYNLTVTNPDGLSDVIVSGFRVITPFVAATGDSLIGNAQPLTITPPSGKPFTSGMIFYRKGGVAGAAAYDSIALTVGTGVFTVSLPASVITIRGVEYYIRLDGNQGSLTYPGVTPAQTPAVLPVRVAKLAAPLSLSPAKYKMFSAPMTLDSRNVLAQLGDDYGAYNTAKWRVFHWETGAYREAGTSAAAAGPMAMDPGKAFWLVTSNGVPFTFKKGTSVPTVQSYTVPLDTGWNQIGNPFAFNVAWSTVGGSAQVAGPYYYDGAQYQIITTDVKPYEGYFVYKPPLQETFGALTFYPVESNLPVQYKDGVASTVPGPGEFIMQIAVALPGTEFRDTYNYLGLRTGATAGRDVLDAPKPPPIGDGVQVDILDGGTTYLQNFKPVAGEGQSWVFDVRTLGTKGKAVMTLTPSGTLPAGFSVHVLDLGNENALPAASGAFEVALDAPDAPRYYKVIVGTDGFVAKESNGIPLTPVSYALEQNYPNPFNPSTTIRYSLAKKSDVVLEICNTLGQRVRTLFNGARSTGDYETIWDGTNDNGGHVASGVYFYRLRTGEYNAVRKLVMIR
jgi:hypothetical protein